MVFGQNEPIFSCWVVFSFLLFLVKCVILLNINVNRPYRVPSIFF